MSIDLTLGFKKKPKNLATTMSNLRFALDEAKPAGEAFPCRMESYRFFDEQGSTRGVWFVYHDGTYEDHADAWRGIVENPTEIVASGTVTTYMDRSALDLEKQIHAAKFLRDRYDAILHDPQSGRRITD